MGAPQQATDDLAVYTIDYYKAQDFETTRQPYSLSALIRLHPSYNQPPVRFYVVPEVSGGGFLRRPQTLFRVFLGKHPQRETRPTAPEANLAAHKNALPMAAMMRRGTVDTREFAGSLGPDNGQLAFSIRYYGKEVPDAPDGQDLTYVAGIHFPLGNGTEQVFHVATRSVIERGRKKWVVNVSGFRVKLPLFDTQGEAVEVALSGALDFAIAISSWLLLEATGYSGTPPDWMKESVVQRP